MHVICAVAAIVVIIDTIVTVVGIVGLSGASRQIQRSGAGSCGEGRRLLAVGQRGVPGKRCMICPESSQERVANMRQLVSSALNWQQRRMIRSFPRMRSTDSTKYSKIMETVREMLRRK